MISISIVIPAYNAQKYIKCAVDSALTQTYRNFEVVVVDDGSTDDTREILKEYGSSIRLICQHNEGTAAACNAGVLAAGGERIAFLDADDQWLPQKLERQMRDCADFAISHTDSICFGDECSAEVRRSAIQKMYSGFVLEKLVVSNFITKSTVIVSRDVYRDAGGFASKYDAVEDWPLWMKICAKHELGYVAEPLARYRVHQLSKSMRARLTDAAHMKIIGDAFSEDGVAREFVGLRRPAIAQSSAINAHYAAMSGDWFWAARCAFRSICNGNFGPQNWKILVKTMLSPLGVKY